MQSLQMAIFEPNELTRHGLQLMLGCVEQKVHIAGSFSDYQSCDAYLKENMVQVLLFDETLPRHLDLWTLVERWRTLRPSMSLVVLSEALSIRHIEKLFRQGVIGYIHRDDCVKSTLSACLEAVAQKQAYVSPRASAALYRRQAHASAQSLSRVDIDVIHALDQGLNTQETALQIGLDVRTIYRSKNNLRQVLGVKTNEQILDAARRRGLVESNS
ncbi:Transcriptional regulatory protein UhpA [Anaerolineae bacterium]|nr:Transcriptional regulatory protein UhpA [Anaerolineae bacterium]